MKVNDGVDEEGDTGPKCIKAEEKGNDNSANEAAEHWNKTENASDEAKGEGESRRDAKDEADDKNGNRSGAGVDEADGYGAGDVLRDGRAETIYDALGALGGVIFVEPCPELLHERRAFSEHEECEDESQDNDGKEASDGGD